MYVCVCVYIYIYMGSEREQQTPWKYVNIYAIKKNMGGW